MTKSEKNKLSHIVMDNCVTYYLILSKNQINNFVMDISQTLYFI